MQISRQALIKIVKSLYQLFSSSIELVAVVTPLECYDESCSPNCHDKCQHPGLFCCSNKFLDSCPEGLGPVSPTVHRCVGWQRG